jgi:hypothetical protein
MGYLQEYDVLEESWDTLENPNAKHDRDTRARELRKQGWTVQIQTEHDNVLDQNSVYSLFAERKKQQVG